MAGRTAGQAALLLDAFRSSAPDPPVPNTGTLEGDLLVLVVADQDMPKISGTALTPRYALLQPDCGRQRIRVKEGYDAGLRRDSRT